PGRVVKLETEAAALPPVAHEPRLAAREQVLPAEAHATRRGPVERAEDVEQRRLADAGRAHERDDLGRPHDEARAPEHAHDLGPRAVLLLQLLGDPEGLEIGR